MTFSQTDKLSSIFLSVATGIHFLPFLRRTIDGSVHANCGGMHDLHKAKSTVTTKAIFALRFLSPFKLLIRPLRRLVDRVFRGLPAKYRRLNHLRDDL
jgi:hypothetical protein